MSLLRATGLVVAALLILYGLFLLMRGDPGDGFKGPLVVGLTALGVGLVVLAAVFAGGNRRTGPLVLLVVAALLPYPSLVGSIGIVLNVVLATLAVLMVWRGVRAGK